MRITGQLLTDQIKKVATSFASDELAFLALTSKIERPFLDRLAFALFSLLRDSGWFVAREWRLPKQKARVDLALFNGQCVDTLIEGKAMMSFDCTRDGRPQSEYPRLLQRDLNRFEHAAFPDAQIFCLLLANHPLDPSPWQMCSNTRGMLIAPSVDLEMQHAFARNAIRTSVSI